VGEKVLVFCLLDVRGGNYRQAKRTASSIFGSDEFRGLEAKWMLRPRVYSELLAMLYGRKAALGHLRCI
jgi:hypothetical protein